MPGALARVHPIAACVCLLAGVGPVRPARAQEAAASSSCKAFTSMGRIAAVCATSWTIHNRATGLPSDRAVAVEVDAAGQVWAGTWGHGVAVRTMVGQWARLNHTNSVRRGIPDMGDADFVVVPSLARDAAGAMWMTNVQTGIAVMSGYPVSRGRLHDLALLGLPPGTELGPLAVGGDGLKFAGTLARGLVILDDGGTPFEGGTTGAAASTPPRSRASGAITSLPCWRSTESSGSARTTASAAWG